MNISATITHAFDTIQGEGRNGQWVKKTYLATYGGNYPKTFAFDVFNANVDKLRDILKPGHLVNINIDIESREYNGRYYTNITAWGATPATASPNGSQSIAPPPPAPPFTEDAEGFQMPPMDATNNLPF